MEDQEKRLNKEICFLIAKFLQQSYPELGKMFIDECEKHQLFPSSVFFNSPSFAQLNQSIYPTIPSNQLMGLLMKASKNYHNPSFLRPLMIQKIPKIQENKRYMPIKRMLGHTFIIYCLSIDKTSQILITGSDDSLIKVWKLPELSLINTYLDHNDVITNIEIHPSNQYFASSSSDGTICIYSLITGILKYKKKLSSGINDIHFSQCGKYFSVSTKENGLFLWIFDDFLNNKPEYRKWSDSNKAKDMWWARFTPYSTLMVFVTSLNDIYAYHIGHKKIKFIYHSPNEIDSISMNHKLPLKIICLLHHQSYFYVFTKSLKPQSVFTKRVKLDVGAGKRIVEAKFNCDETIIIALTKNSGIYGWNAESLTLTYQIDNINYLRRCHLLLTSPIDPYFIFVANKDNFCSFWDLSKSPTQSNQLQPVNLDVDDNENEEENATIIDNDEDTNNDTENLTTLEVDSTVTTKDTINIKPILSYVLYFRLASVSWSPNGEYIVGSDDLQGFTLFIRTTGEVDIKTEHQFLLKEKEKCEKAQIMFDIRAEMEENNELETDSQNQQQDMSSDDQLQNSNIDDYQNILVDAEWNPIIPQPRRWKFYQINLRIKEKEVSPDIIQYESSLSRIFRK